MTTAEAFGFGNVYLNGSSTVRLEKLTVIQLVRKISLYGSGSSLTSLKLAYSGTYTEMTELEPHLQARYISLL